MNPRRFLSMFLFTLVVSFSSVFAFTGKVYAQTTDQIVNPLFQNEPIIHQQSELLSQKADALNDTSQQIQDLKSKKESLAQKLADEKQAIEDLKQKIADKKAAETRAAEVKNAISTSSVTTLSGGLLTNCGDNYYAAYIYGMESGGRVVGHCNTYDPNGSGCYGIGQACPGSKLLAACPNLDYACENAYFTKYANDVYGGWAGAYSAWQSKGWW
jgi:hypothetical protein